MEKYSSIINEFFKAGGLDVDDFFVFNVWTRQREICFQGFKNEKVKEILTGLGLEFKPFGEALERSEVMYLTYKFIFIFDIN